MHSIKRGWLLLAAGGLLSWLSTFFLSGDEGLLRIGEFVAPGIVIVTCIAVVAVLLMDSAVNMFTPIGPFVAMVLLYFGIGAIVPAIADYATSEFMKALFDYSLDDIVAVHRISGLGIATLSIVAFLTLRARADEPLVVGARVDPQVFQRSVVILYVVGMAVSLTVTLPAAIGLFRDVVPTAIAQFGRLATVSMLLMGFGLSKRILPRRVFLWAYLAGFVVLMGGAVLTLSKLEMFTQAAGAFGGFLLASPSRRTLGLAVVIAGVSFIILTPIVLAARGIDALTDNTLSGRLESGKATLELGAELLETEDLPNIPMSRIQYVNTMAWARSEFDNGRPGKSLTQDALWIFVPRSIWPEKPLLANTGRYITSILIDYEVTSSTGITVFGEGYWNGGFTGLIAVSAFAGLLLGLLTRFSFDALATMDVASMIWVWGGGLMGMRIDGFFMTDYIGQVVILSLTFLLLRALLATHAGAPTHESAVA